MMKNMMLFVVLMCCCAALASPIKSTVAARSSMLEGPIDEASYMPSDYIQDGIIAIWDGQCNAGWDQHVDFTNEWVDLVGGFVLRTTLDADGNPTYGDFTKGCASYERAFYNGPGDPIKQNGIRYYYQANVLAIDVNRGYFTIEVVHRPMITGWSSWQMQNTGIKLASALNSHTSIGFIADGSVMVERGILTDGTNKIQTGMPFIDRAIESRAVAFNSSTLVATAYKNNVLVGAAELNDVFQQSSYSDPILHLNTMWGFIKEGNRNSWAPHSSGSYVTASSDIYCVRVYNRPLEDDERLHNFTIDKARFKLK